MNYRLVLVLQDKGDYRHKVPYEWIIFSLSINMQSYVSYILESLVWILPAALLFLPNPLCLLTIQVQNSSCFYKIYFCLVRYICLLVYLNLILFSYIYIFGFRFAYILVKKLSKSQVIVMLHIWIVYILYFKM